MPKNKKPSKNGYWQFVMECRDKPQNRNMSMGELQNYASKKWTNMSKEERKPYENMASLARNTYHPVRLTSDGLEIDEIEKQEREALNIVQRMKNDISRNLKAAATTNTLDEQIFLLIHFNHLTYHSSSDKYFICEVAVLAFSMKNGIEDMFHSVVRPGKLPLGFYGPALTHSKETHQMCEYVQQEPHENNTQQVFKDIVHFMRRYECNNELPILYADEKTLEMTTKVFNTFCAEFNFTQPIKIYLMQYMFYALRNAAAGQTIWPSETFSYNEIEKDVYSYSPNISCEFHEGVDVTLYCSKAIVTRYAYTICDSCCADLGIQLVPGFHVPAKAKVNQERLNPISKTGSLSSFNSNEPNLQRGRFDSFSSTDGYEENFPALGGGRSSASSMISFSSMNSRAGSRRLRETTANKLAQSLRKMQMEESNRNLQMEESRRDYGNMKFPQHGFSGRSSQKNQ